MSRIRANRSGSLPTTGRSWPRDDKGFLYDGTQHWADDRGMILWYVRDMATENRTDEDIKHLAEAAAAEVLAATPTPGQTQSTERGMAIRNALDDEKSSAARLNALISGDVSFGDLRAGWIQQPDMGMAVQGHVLPYLLINAIIDGHSPIPLIEDALRLTKVLDLTRPYPFDRLHL